MAWTELHENLTAHPKMADLASMLGIPKWQAQGIVTCLWTYCLSYGPGGIIKDWRKFCAYIEYKEDKETLVDCLKDSGWVDENNACHDWHDYAGRLEEIRRKDAERKRISRGCPVDETGNPRRPPNQPTNQQTQPTNQQTQPTNQQTVSPPASSTKRARFEYTDEFEDFWKLRPKGGKAAAFKVWQKMGDQDQTEAMYKAVEWAGIFTDKNSEAYKFQKDTEGWLSGRRWEDNPDEWRRAVTKRNPKQNYTSTDDYSDLCK